MLSFVMHHHWPLADARACGPDTGRLFFTRVFIVDDQLKRTRNLVARYRDSPHNVCVCARGAAGGGSSSFCCCTVVGRNHLID